MGEQKTVKNNKIGVLGAVSYIIGNIIGSGIFIAPTSVLIQTNSIGLSLVVWIVAGMIATLGSFCYVELGTSIRASGADFAYLCYVKAYPVAFAFMCVGCALQYPATVAIHSQTFSEYIFKGFDIELESETAQYFAKKLLGFSLILLLLFLNFLSLRVFVARFQIIASFAKVAATTLVIITGFYFLIFKGETENLAKPFEGSNYSMGALLAALFAGLYSYDGWDILNFGAEEIEKPKRTMPLSIIFGMSLVVIIYLCTNLAYFTVLDVNTMKASTAVASMFAKEKLGSFQLAIPFLISLLLIGSMNSTMFSASRYLYAAARRGHLPTFISCLNPETDSPRAALIVNVILAMGISFLGDPASLIIYVGFAMWSLRGFTIFALLWIRFRHIPVHPDAIKTPIIMPISFFIICTALISVTLVKNFSVAAFSVVIVIFGLIIYFTFIYDRALPSLSWFRKFRFCFNDVTTSFVQIILNVMPSQREESEQSSTTKVPIDEFYSKENGTCTTKKSLSGDSLCRRTSRVAPCHNNDNGPPPYSQTNDEKIAE